MKLDLYNLILNLNQTHKAIANKIVEKSYYKTSLLDVGGGSGLLAHHLEKDFENITILEPSKKMRKHIFNHKIIPHKIEQLTTINQDTVVLFDTLHHLENPKQQLRRLLKLNPKELIIIEPNVETLQGRWIQFLENTIFHLNTHFFKKEDFQNIFKNAEIEEFKSFIIIYVKN